jgi:hypothetical protein
MIDIRRHHDTHQASSIAAVRQEAAKVATEAELITIRTDKVVQYTKQLMHDYPLIKAMDDNHFASIDYVMALDSINFGSGYFEIAKEAGVTLEYDVISRGLKHAFIQGEMNTPEKWARASAALCHDIFSVPMGAHHRLDRLMDQFAHHLQVTGTMIEGFFDGHVSNLLEEAKGSAVRLAEIVAAWPTFHDVADYKGRKVPLLKRAQIIAADIHLTLGGKGLGAFRDMDGLTIFADNMVPHVLRFDGILEYTPELAKHIDSGAMIEASSVQ